MANVKVPVLRAVMTALGFKTEDAARVETAMTAVETADVASEHEGKFNELANDMKSIKDWMKARDSEREEEKRKSQEAKDAAEAEVQRCHRVAESLRAGGGGRGT